MENRDLEALRRSLPPITDSFFDVKRIFYSKNPSLGRIMPGFVYRYLSRVIHQEEMNRFLYSHRDQWGLDFIAAILEKFGITTTVTNLHYVPADSRIVIASNHPLGGMDGIALMGVVGEVRKDIIFPVNDLLMNIPNLYELFIPINKHGSNADNIRVFNDTFASSLAILYFPAGLVSRKMKGVIRDLEWKKTFLTKAKASKRDIVPVHIAGRNSDFFYNLANLRKKVGIKANIEMLYLVNEMFNLKDKNLKISFGKPIPWDVFDRRYPDQEWAARLRDHVYELEKDPEKDFIP